MSEWTCHECGREFEGVAHEIDGLIYCPDCAGGRGRVLHHGPAAGRRSIKGLSELRAAFVSGDVVWSEYTTLAEELERGQPVEIPVAEPVEIPVAEPVEADDSLGVPHTPGVPQRAERCYDCAACGCAVPFSRVKSVDGFRLITGEVRDGVAMCAACAAKHVRVELPESEASA